MFEAEILTAKSGILKVAFKIRKGPEYGGRGLLKKGTQIIFLSRASERGGGGRERKIMRTGKNLKRKDKEVPRKTKKVIPMWVAEEEIVIV